MSSQDSVTMPPKACMQYQSYTLDPLFRLMVWKTSHSLQYVLQVVAYTPTFKRSQRETRLKKKLSHVIILLFFLFSSIKSSTLQMECWMWTHHLVHNIFPSFGCILNPWHYQTPNFHYMLTKFCFHVLMNGKVRCPIFHLHFINAQIMFYIVILFT